MKYDLLTVPEKEQPLLFQPKPNTPAHQTKVGCVRGDFGKSGDEFNHTWFPHKEELNTDEFKTELTRVINSLRSEFSHPLLKSRDEMLKYCKEHPENELRGHWIEGTHVFKIEVPKYTFYLRCLPVFGDYNFYVICYIVTDEKEIKRRTQDEETYILGELLWALHLYDVRVWFDDNDVLQAEDDDGNKWIGIEFYKFLTEECLDFEPDGTLSEGLYVEEELLEMYKAYSVKNGVIPGKPSRDENEVAAMETIDMKIYEPVPGKKGLVREVGFRKAKDVFHELEERLRQLGLYPDEYFVLNSPYDDKGALFPETVTMNCYANWGGSEGIYLEVDLIAVEDGKLVRRNFATGKSLAEDGDSFDRLQYTAGVIYKLFYGERFMPTRYLLIPQDEKQNRSVLQSRVEREFRDFVRRNMLHDNERGEEYGMAIGLRAMILAELPQCTVPPDKLKELMDSDNALELLTKICAPVCEPNKFEINDLISSCDSFIKELERRRHEKLGND